MYEKEYLEKLGHTVIITRDTQTKDLTLYARGTKAAGCDLFMSDHTNAVGSNMNESVDYVVTYHLTNDNSTDIDEKSKELAGQLSKVIAEVMGTKQAPQIKSRLSDNDKNKDGFKNDNYYGVLHGARMVGVPAVLCEHSFHTNSKVVDWLLVDANIKKLAMAKVEVIHKFLTGKSVSLEEKFETSPTMPTRPTIVETEYAQKFNKEYAGSYKVAPNKDNYVMLRAGAGAKKPELLRVITGATVKCYGYYSMNGSTTWLYVVFNGQPGFMSKNYLVKK
jgi:hypothetical protein